ncbi:ABC transporter permease [Spiractinospora alimapuensis]|uniref:ABC transporter permease n=1 Tax=Spiractinospora alimapuensis TaxID=2820884 RepID=UPI001F371509|nr:ABC transporter permease [Spiractinospora alimapuensis]QVQ50313.1 ABC transporter permease [Spiractinospora alimapuensis]
MTPYLRALRLGVARGRIEFLHSITQPQELFQYFFWPIIFFVVMLFMRNSTVPGTEFSLGASVLPGVIGMNVAFAMIGVASILVTEREDGTLLRAKSTPNGMLSYLVAKTFLVAAMTAMSALLILLGGIALFGSDVTPSVTGAVLLVVVFVLGMLAVVPIGAAIGALITNPRSMGLVFLPMGGLISISGIFYPITAMATWLQAVAQVFPVYWLGLGMRSALLPSEMAAAEIGESWRHLETLGVLGVWAVLGLVLAPPLLRRMARRESGSAVQSRREDAMKRVG